MSTGADSAHSKRTLFLRLLALIVFSGVTSWAVWYFVLARWHVSTEDAYVNGNIVQITPMVMLLSEPPKWASAWLLVVR